MHLTDSSLINLNKKDLLCLLLDYQGKFNSILDDLKNNFDQLKSKFTKLEVNLNIFRNVNSKLSDSLTNVGTKWFANKPYSRRECLEISAFLLVSHSKNWIPIYTVFWKKFTPPADAGLVEDCQSLPSKENLKKLILKLSSPIDAKKVLLNEKNWKTINLRSYTKIYINESLCTYYKKLWSKSKKLWYAEHILSLLVSNGLIGVKKQSFIHCYRRLRFSKYFSW